MVNTNNNNTLTIGSGHLPPIKWEIRADLDLVISEKDPQPRLIEGVEVTLESSNNKRTFDLPGIVTSIALLGDSLYYVPNIRPFLPHFAQPLSLFYLPNPLESYPGTYSWFLGQKDLPEDVQCLGKYLIFSVFQKDDEYLYLKVFFGRDTYNKFWRGDMSYQEGPFSIWRSPPPYGTIWKKYSPDSPE